MAKYGFLGLGIMGKGMAANLLRKGFEVSIWNRSPEKCAPLVELGAIQRATPKEVVGASDITFAMLSTPEVAKEVVFGLGGVLEGIHGNCGYIDMSTVDDLTAQAIAQAVAEKSGRYLEAPVSGTKKPAEDGTLVILAGGDESLFEEARPAFEAMAKKSFYLGSVGQGARMKLVINMIMGGMMAAFGEGLALGQKVGLDGNQILEVLASGAMTNPMFTIKGAMLLNEEFPTSFPLKHMQKDLRLAIELSERVQQPLSASAATNELFKRAIAAGLKDEDFSAVFKVIK